MFAVVLDMHLHLTFFIWIEEFINYFSNILKQRLGPFLYIHARQFSVNLRFDGNNLFHYLKLSIFKSLELRRQVRSPQDIKYFLCDEPENEKSPLNLVQSFRLDQRVRRFAHILNDSLLHAKLQGGDLIAQDVKNHRYCLTNLYRKA